MINFNISKYSKLLFLLLMLATAINFISAIIGIIAVIISDNNNDYELMEYVGNGDISKTLVIPFEDDQITINIPLIYNESGIIYTLYFYKSKCPSCDKENYCIKLNPNLEVIHFECNRCSYSWNKFIK